MNEPSRYFLLAALAVILVACDDPSRQEAQPIALPIPAIDAETSLQETRDRVRDTVADPDSAAALLDALANARDALREGNRPAARAHVYDFIQRLEGLVADRRIAPTLGDELLLHGGESLSTIGFAGLCAVTPGALPPAFLYSSRVVCVARLPADPSDPESPLPPDSEEHCNPVAESLQLELLDRALAVCNSDPYGCVPVAGNCPTVCQKSATPGFTIPRVSFTADSVNCDDEAVKKHSCVATGFYFCSCACSQIEDT